MNFRDALLISFGNSLISFVAGFMVFGFVGFMAVSTNQSIDRIIGQGMYLLLLAVIFLTV